MASASFTPGAQSALRGRPRRAPSSGGVLTASARVRWDRIGRVALLCVMVALVFLYVSAGFHMFSKWRQSRHDGAALARMQREHAALVSQHQQLAGPGAVEAAARKLGMMHAGEQPYVVTGLPKN